MANFSGLEGSGNVVWHSDSTGTNITSGSTLTVTTTHESDGGIQMDTTTTKVGKKHLNPKLYFRYLKTNLTTLELKNLKARQKTLINSTKKFKEVGQQAAFEEFSKRLALVARECEAVACGYDKVIFKKDIDKFKKFQNLRADVYFKKLEDFPREIPDEIIEHIQKVNDNDLFDELWILFLDYTDEPELKTNKQKIREKDPIIFGKYKYNDERYYYIADWIDEFCDLTLDKFVDQMTEINKKNDENYIEGEVYSAVPVEEIDEDYVKAILDEVTAKQKRLDETRMGNYRQNMQDEDEENKKVKPKVSDRKLAMYAIGYVAGVLAISVGCYFLFRGHFQ